MKFILCFFILSGFLGAAPVDQFISGKVEMNKLCSKKVMVWLSLDKENYKERLLLLHTLVPVGGSFKFNVRPGDYQLRASDETGCEFLRKVSVNELNPHVLIKMEKK
jgi:hypothetical protein